MTEEFAVDLDSFFFCALESRPSLVYDQQPIATDNDRGVCSWPWYFFCALESLPSLVYDQQPIATDNDRGVCSWPWEFFFCVLESRPSLVYDQQPIGTDNDRGVCSWPWQFFLRFRKPTVPCLWPTAHAFQLNVRSAAVHSCLLRVR